MPPRRSCFRPGLRPPGRFGLVSMPPRRSCFGVPHGVGVATKYVSMPPRRSCFSRTHAGASPPAARFQCHHGVPASSSVSSPPATRKGVSMPPRRSCFPPDVTPSVRINPVSMPPRRSCFKRVTGSSATSAWSFNATTAFLLRGGLQHCMS